MHLCEDVQKQKFLFRASKRRKRAIFCLKTTEREGDLVYFITPCACKKSGRIVSRVFCLTLYTRNIFTQNGFFFFCRDDGEREHFEWSWGEQQESNSVLARGDDFVFFIFFFHSEKTKNGVVTIHSARSHDDEDWRRKRKRKEQKKKKNGRCRDGDE